MSGSFWLASVMEPKSGTERRKNCRGIFRELCLECPYLQGGFASSGAVHGIYPCCLSSSCSFCFINKAILSLKAQLLPSFQAHAGNPPESNRLPQVEHPEWLWQRTLCLGFPTAKKPWLLFNFIFFLLFITPAGFLKLGYWSIKACMPWISVNHLW